MKVVYSARALDDLERLFDFLLQNGTGDPSEAAEAIADAVTALARNPFLGRPVMGPGIPLRELVISFGKTGYLALYRVRRGRIDVLALRHQREAGYPER